MGRKDVGKIALVLENAPYFSWLNLCVEWRNGYQCRCVKSLLQPVFVTIGYADRSIQADNTALSTFACHCCRALAMQNTHTHLMALCPGLPRWAGTRKVPPVWILLKQETVSGSGISWAYMQVCTSLQTDNHASAPPLSFYRPDAVPVAQPTASKHWRHWPCSNQSISPALRADSSKPAVSLLWDRWTDTIPLHRHLAGSAENVHRSGRFCFRHTYHNYWCCQSLWCVSAFVLLSDDCIDQDVDYVHDPKDWRWQQFWCLDTGLYSCYVVLLIKFHFICLQHSYLECV